MKEQTECPLQPVSIVDADRIREAFCEKISLIILLKGQLESLTWPDVRYLTI